MGGNESPFPLKEKVRNGSPKCSAACFEPLAHLGRSDLQNRKQPGNVAMADYCGKHIFSPHSSFVVS